MFKKSTKRSSEKKVPILETKDLTISISLDGRKSFEGMNNNQKEFFNYFKLKIGENKALNLHDNLSYIFCYLYEILNPKNPHYDTFNSLWVAPSIEEFQVEEKVIDLASKIEEREENEDKIPF